MQCPLNTVKKWLNSNTKIKSSSLYQQIGGEKVVRQLSDSFYDIMQAEPEVKALRQIHTRDLTETRQRFFEFMSGWLGGPPLFEQNYGHPRLRARHLHVKVDQIMISQWLYCMNKALENTVPQRKYRQLIYQNLQPLAQHMLNTPTP